MTYYFNVQPEGNSAIVSNTIQQDTKLSSVVEQNQDRTVRWNVLTEGLRVWNLPSDCQLNVLDIMGKSIETLKPTSSEVLLPLPQKGIYLLQIQQNATINNYKIIY